MHGQISLPKTLWRSVGSLAAFIAMGSTAFAGVSLDHSKITEVINSVSVLDPRDHKTGAASANELFQVPEIMKTGDASRSEMLADDKTITRVGADSLFSFEPDTRLINLKRGSILFQSQPGNGGGSIRTASATASVLGTTIIVVATKDGGFKLLVLEGTGQVTLASGVKIIVHAGQLYIVAPGGHKSGPVMDFRVSELVKTSLLVNGFKRKLPSWDKILKVIELQEGEIGTGGLVPPGTYQDPNPRINQNLGGNHLSTPSTGTIVPLPTPIPTPRPTPPHRINTGS